jgi:hypothetical protein
LHTGFDNHVELPQERVNKHRRKLRDRIKLLAVLVVGVIVGWALSDVG